MRAEDSSRSKQEKLIEVLEKVAPGMELREAIDRIMQVGSGALLVVGPLDELKPIMSGGFKIGCEFTAPRCYELAKMDGALICSHDLRYIHSANVHLVPDPRITTHEAGTRHRTAERVAKQTSAFVIAISEKMHTVSLYVGDDHFTLESIPLVLAKADQALQTLSRYRARLERESANLSRLEVEDMVTLREVVKVVERSEMVIRMADEVRFQVSELGKDGRLVSLQLTELMAGVRKSRELLIKDYYIPRDGKEPDSVIRELGAASGEELTDDATVTKILGYRGSAELLNKMVRPRGYRVLSMIPRIPASVVNKLVKRFDNLKNIMRASHALLDEVDGVGERRAMTIKEGLDRISASIVKEPYL